MKEDSRLFQMLSDHRAMEAKFGPLDFRQFAAVWMEAHAFTDEALSEGFRPEELPHLYSWLNSGNPDSEK